MQGASEIAALGKCGAQKDHLALVRTAVTRNRGQSCG